MILLQDENQLLFSKLIR